jgi:hypothetical protein
VLPDKADVLVLTSAAPSALDEKKVSFVDQEIRFFFLSFFLTFFLLLSYSFFLSFSYFLSFSSFFLLLSYSFFLSFLFFLTLKSDIALGTNHSIVATTTGLVFCIGSNQHGQLGFAVCSSFYTVA